MPAGLCATATLAWLLLAQHPPGWRRRAWQLLLAALCVELTATILWLYADAHPHALPPAALTALNLLDYALLTAALLAFVADSGNLSGRRRTWLDYAILVLGVLAAQLPYIIEPLLALEPGYTGSVAKIVGYAVWIAFTGAAAGLLFMSIENWRADPPAMLVTAAIGVALTADLFVNAASVHGQDPVGGIDNIGYCASYALLTAAAAAERRYRIARASRGAGLRETYGVTPVLAVLVAIVVVLGTQAGRGGLTLTFATVLAMICAVLLVVRQRSVRAELMRLNTELIARQSEARLTELVRRSTDVILIVDRSGGVSYASPAAETVFGLPPAALRRVSATALFGAGNEQRITRFIDHVLAEPATHAELEVDVSDAAGRSRSVNVIASNQLMNPLIDGLTLTLRDVTEQRALERELIRIAQTERQRLCGDVHEGLGQELAGISFLIESLRSNQSMDGTALRAALDPVARHTRRTIHTVRTLARALSPLQVVQGSLERALQALAVDVDERLRIPVTVQISGETVASGETSAEHLYRIAQEAINNAARHSGCTRIAVELRRDGAWLSLTVTDDGRGLAEGGDLEERPGLGLRMMVYRARLMRGTIRFERAPGGGTRVDLRVPAAEAAAS